MTELTPTERGAQALQMAIHRRARCKRCKARIDLADGFVCGKGEDAEVVMLDPRSCRVWVFEEEQSEWL